MMGSLAGLEWARYIAKRQKQREEAKKYTRQFAETQIEWQLPETMSLKKVRTSWYVNGSKIIGCGFTHSFIYVLRDINSNEVRYVGQTSEPARRYMEHRLDDKLGVQFKMIIVDLGDAETEREWIARCIADGCKLLNVVLTKSKVE